MNERLPKEIEELEARDRADGEFEPFRFVPEEAPEFDIDEHGAAVAEYLDDREIGATTPAESCESAPTPDLSWNKFPVVQLPEPWRTWTDAMSEAMDVDPAYLGLPLLSTGAGAIGNTRIIRVGDVWDEPSVLWTVLAARSGEKKTPCLWAVAGPLHKADQLVIERYAEQREQYERDLEVYRQAMRKRQDAGPDERGADPTPPLCTRYVIDDVTIEGTIERLADNWRGLNLICDELAQLFAFDAYKSVKGADRPKWLKMYNAKRLVRDRVSGNRPTISIERATVSITGGIQPGILAKAFNAEAHEAGLASRFLLAHPPERLKTYPSVNVADGVPELLTRAFDGLLQLQPQYDKRGKPYPHALGLSPEADRVWRDFYHENAALLHNETDERMRAALAKYEGACLRIALVHYLVRSVTGDLRAGNKGMIDADSMRAAVELVRWFTHETRRVYHILATSSSDSRDNEIVEWIRVGGGDVSASELSRYRRDVPDADSAKLILHRLADAGRGKLYQPPQNPNGGQPASVRIRLKG